MCCNECCHLPWEPVTCWSGVICAGVGPSYPVPSKVASVPPRKWVLHPAVMRVVWAAAWPDRDLPGRDSASLWVLAAPGPCLP